MRPSRAPWLLLALAVFAAAAIAGVGAFLLRRFQAAALEDAAERSTLLVGARAHLLGEELAQLVAEVDRLSRLAEIDLADETLEPEKRVLKIARRDTLLFSIAIAILDPAGAVLWAEPAGARPRRSGVELVALARARGRATTSFSEGEIAVSAPVAGRGAIVALVPGSEARDLFGEGLRRAVGASGSAALLLEGRRGEELPVAPVLGANRPPGDLRLASPGQAWLEGGGRRWLVTEAAVDGQALVLRLVQAADEVERELARPLRGIEAAVGVAAALVLAGGALLTLLARRLERAQRELARAQDLAAMGRTSAAIAHEVKNALNGLSISLDLLATGRVEPATARAVHGQARAEIERLREVADDLTVFAAPPRLAVEDVDLAGLVRRAAALVADLAEERGVTVDVAAAKAIPVRADAAKLLGALVNLARNGIESMGPSSLSAPRDERPRLLEIRASAADRRALVEVADRGPGVDPEVRERLFEPFVTTKRTGTGLGLAIARRVVEAHGGTISALEREGGGSVFQIALPREEPRT